MRRWALLAALLVLLLAVGWWFLLIAPRNTRISDAHDDLQTAREQELGLRSQIAQLQAINEAKVEYLAGIGKMDALIPDQPLLDQFIEEIYSLSQSTGVELLNLSPAVPVLVPDSQLRAITVSATIEGDFFETLGFLFGVMDMERLVRVDGISVSSSQDQNGATMLNVSLSMRLFTLSDLVPVATTIPDNGAGTTETTTSGEASPSTTVAASTQVTTTLAGEG
jgi:Tfp pilus assembly protein PilO